MQIPIFSSAFKPLLAVRRTKQSDQNLGAILALVAGAINAGGFVAIGKYTSHMTGITSSVADDLAQGRLDLGAMGIAMVAAFVTGAATTAFLVNWARRSRHSNPFILPISLEACLLLLFGLIEGGLASALRQQILLTGLLLPYLMGLQNALITKVAMAEIRTTHVTGVVTDMGIEIGKLLYWNRDKIGGKKRIIADRQKLMSHATILGAFFIGGVLGALGFKVLGYYAVLPPACLLFLLVQPHWGNALFSKSSPH